MDEHTHIVVVGAGFSGLGTGIRLKQNGVDDFLILDRAPAVGGTWWRNTYPGAACDVPSTLYSFSFAPSAKWTHSYSDQATIHRYLEQVTDDFGLRPHLRLRRELMDAKWDPGHRRWLLNTSGGTITSDFLVVATGPLTEPKIPDLPGLAAYPGPVFHSVDWDHDVDLSGKRVAVVGSGASAVQLLPALQPVVDRLVLFQRTPTWILPQRNREVSPRRQRLFARAPFVQRVTRSTVRLLREALAGPLVHWPWLLPALRMSASAHLRRQVPDRDLRARLTPDFRIGCKRLLVSNAYYPALTRPNVHVVPGLAAFDGTTAIDSDGTRHDVDAVVLATGFHTTDLAVAGRITGAHGRTLADVWQGSPRAHRGTTAAGFPNLFLVNGPNTGVGHTSVLLQVEIQIAYLVNALTSLRAKGLTVFDTKQHVQDRWERRGPATVAPHGLATRRLRQRLLQRLDRPQHHTLAGNHHQLRT